MTPDAIGPLLAMAQATTIHDAHGHAVDAVKAGATGDEVRQAITEWMRVQAAQVQHVADLPPYDHEPVTTPDGLSVVGWSGPGLVARCKCGHLKSSHGTDRRSGAMCFGSAVCGCASYRPKETEQ